MRSAMVLIIVMIVTNSECSNKKTLGTSDLEKFLQPNDILNYNYFNSNTCTRECKRGSKPRICYYRFFLEDYSVLSPACQNCTTNITQCYNPQCVTADGYPRGISVVNRRLPGPAIQVCYGDRIIVDVMNMMPGRSTTIHWHGMFLKETPYFDGVPMVTQCPIIDGDQFRYDFYARQKGTYFWHSHNGIQKVDGLQGPFIIREDKRNDPNRHLYDYDLPAHVIFINDWYHTDAAQHFPGPTHNGAALNGTYYLINGGGQYTDPRTGNPTTTPYTVFRVTPGKRYRFRVIGALCTLCPAKFSIEGHKLTLIATDANAVRPVVVDHVIIVSGERYDFVVNAMQEVRPYWITVRGLGSCLQTNAHQMAVLEYEGYNGSLTHMTVTAYEDYNNPGVILNPPNATCGANQPGICVSQLETAENFDKRILTPNPDVNIEMRIGYYFPTVEELFQSNSYHRYENPGGMLTPIFMVNNIYYHEPPSPILTQRQDIPAHIFCSNDNKGVPTCERELCDCLQVIRVPLHSVVQFIILDQSTGGGINHAFHLHGYVFNIMAMGYLYGGLPNATYIAQIVNSNVKGHPGPTFKDTVAVPSAGFTALRIIADNPGYWLFHCHFTFHQVVGMALLIQVGDPKDMPPIPKGFPKCGDYLPRVSFRDEL